LSVSIFALKHGHTHATSAGSATSTPSSSSSASVSRTSPAAGGKSSSSRAASSRSSGSSGSGSGSGSVTKLPLIVLNNTTTSGLAERAAHDFEAGGWTVTSYGNYTNNILSTCAYYDPDVAGAKAAATALRAQFPKIQRVLPKFSGLQAGPVIVILTPDYDS
jgi:LytR cell envelope-related transcriptional attenuator